jgi:hypothetical protein
MTVVVMVSVPLTLYTTFVVKDCGVLFVRVCVWLARDLQAWVL